MDQARFQEAQQAYEAGDFRTAAKTFLLAAGKSPAGNGAAFHMAGNALMRLRRHQDAITVYGLALRDDAYDRRGPVHANLGQAYTATGDYAEAVGAFEAALQEPSYATPWKAWQGAATALLERGRVDEAAVAYRKAAIEPGNPEPAKALVNLGLCFMALGRPSDAAEAYKAALGFDSYAGRGKALCNLGIAYTQMGDYDNAVKAFEKATQLHSHTLSPTAQQAYDSALSARRPSAEIVDGWETGDLVAVGGFVPASDGWASGDLAALDASGPMPVSLIPEHAEVAADALGFGDEVAVNSFFERTEAEMKQRDREERRGRRSSGTPAGALRGVLALAIIVVVAGCVLGAAYWMGYGFPTQATTVTGLLSSYQSGGDITEYWVGAPDKDVDKEMAKIPPVSKFTVDTVEKGTNTSVVGITVEPKKGAALHFKVTLAREGVGWKVTGIDNDWRSTDG